MQICSEQLRKSSMEVKNAVNSQRLTWFMQGIWMNNINSFMNEL